jgi:hypothetical protein
MDRFLLHAKSAFPTSLWVMQEVEQCRRGAIAENTKFYYLGFM